MVLQPLHERKLKIEGENQKLVLGASVIDRRIAILNANIFLKKTVPTLKYIRREKLISAAEFTLESAIISRTCRNKTLYIGRVGRGRFY